MSLSEEGLPYMHRALGSIRSTEETSLANLGRLGLIKFTSLLYMFQRGRRDSCRVYFKCVYMQSSSDAPLARLQ